MFEKELEKFRSVQIRELFVERILAGDNLSEAAARCGVNVAVVLITRQNEIEFDNTIRLAQKFRVDVMVDRLENVQDYEDNPIMARVISENIKWLATKRNREIYGDKVDVNHNVTIDIKAAIIEARKRTLEYIDLQPIETKQIATDNISVTDAIEAVELADIDALS